MLYTLDILIGFTLVMLVLSMAVTVLTQMIGSELANLQGQALRVGVSRLLILLDNGLSSGQARTAADHILRNPLIAKPTLFGKNKLATVVHREELVKLVLDFAATGVAEQANPDTPDDLQAIKNQLRSSLAANGIPDPADVLAKVQMAMLALEQTNPELSHSARVNMALLANAASKFLAMFNGWFDQTIDRVSELFAARIRLVTIVLSLLLAFYVQLDSFQLINRLWANPDLVNQMVGMSQDVVERGEAAEQARRPAAAPTATPGNASEAADAGNASAADEPASVDGNGSGAIGNGSDTARKPLVPAGPAIATRSEVKADLGKLEAYGIIAFPRSVADWTAGWSPPPDAAGNRPASRYWAILHLLGILLTAALLSLGSPWWYAMLRDLLKLRSTVARRDDEQRAERQTTQAPAAGTAGGGGGAGGGDNGGGGNP